MRSGTGYGTINGTRRNGWVAFLDNPCRQQLVIVSIVKIDIAPLADSYIDDIYAIVDSYIDDTMLSTLYIYQ